MEGWYDEVFCRWFENDGYLLGKDFCKRLIEMRIKKEELLWLRKYE